ncbi:MAG: ShlB/FhaC/HecB family hemolysin secretion/activation protein [Sphingobacteriia bacterium]|nr:ShlB/FhaC/HecB family hemolysin secretion/activation protein [Sphingobacteriia bacterium]
MFPLLPPLAISNISLRNFLILIILILFNQVSLASCYKNIRIINSQGIFKNSDFIFLDCLSVEQLTSFLNKQQKKLDQAGYKYSTLELKSKKHETLIFETKYSFISKITGTQGALLSEGQIFNIHDIDQAIEHTNRLKTLHTKVNLSKKEDKINVEFVNKQIKPINVNYYYSNQGYEHTPKQTISFDIENKLGFYEILSLNLGKTPGGKSSGVNFSISIKEYLLKFKYSKSVNKTSLPQQDNNNTPSVLPSIQRVKGVFQVVKNDPYINRLNKTVIDNWQYSNVRGIGLDKTIARNKNYILGLGVELENRRPNNVMGSIQTKSSPLTVAKLDINHSYHASNYNNNFIFSISKGLKIGHPQKDKIERNYKYNPRAQFIKYEIENTFNTKIFGKSYSVNVSAQRAYHSLYNEEKVALASFGYVRGYYNESANVENALVFKQDYTLADLRYYNSIIRPYIFADYGVGTKSKQKGSYYLSSYGTGVLFHKERVSGGLLFSTPFKNNLKINSITTERLSGPSIFINLKINII